MAEPGLGGTAEPSLAVVAAPGAVRRRVGRIARLTLAMGMLVGGTAVLGANGRLGVPFEHVTTLTGRLASVGDLFEDPRMTRLLRKHGLKVDTLTAGSREVANGSLEGLDFVFPSGEDAAMQIKQTRQRQGRYDKDWHPFASPLVLASYRPYADALAADGDARATGPLYYSLDMARFLKLGTRTWQSIGFRTPGATSGNLVLAHTSDICQSNSADSYLGLIAFTFNGLRVPTGYPEADRLAARMRDLVLRQGVPGADLMTSYVSRSGPAIDPVVVVYEHQFLAYQAAYRAAHGEPDDSRVLLYPSSQLLSRPSFIALDHRADRLGELLASDPEIRRRETELGYRVTGSEALDGTLRKEHVPVPDPTAGGLTSAEMPDTPVLERMIDGIKDCP
ncbi:hypothetical protein OG900_19355 [Streptomyces sp. NBC_00433]